MSTFDGHIRESPYLQVDFFRSGAAAAPGRPAPRACLLSHAHNDYLAGLAAHRGPFVYCSAATRAMVLRLTRRLGRLAFARGDTGACSRPCRSMHPASSRPLAPATPSRSRCWTRTTVSAASCFVSLPVPPLLMVLGSKGLPADLRLKRAEAAGTRRKSSRDTDPRKSINRTQRQSRALRVRHTRGAVVGQLAGPPPSARRVHDGGPASTRSRLTVTREGRGGHLNSQL